MNAREEQPPRTPLVHAVEDEDQSGYWARCGRHFLMTGSNPWFAKAIKEIPTIEPLDPWKAVEVDEPTTCIECLGLAP